MITYDEGYELGKRDLERFGIVFAVDKLDMLDKSEDFEKGYSTALKDHA